jgi:hypothetical protein
VFGGFCLLFFGHALWGTPRLPVYKVWFVFVFLPDIFLVLGQIFLIRIHLTLCGLGCFCLESLILAQDERWRRA